MSAEGEFYIPEDDILRELGLMQVLHSQLDHTLRLAIKRMLGISIDDPGYWNETRGMARELRDRARKLIEEKYRADDNMADTLSKVLEEAEAATLLRNRALHSVWIKKRGCEEPVLHDRDYALKQHRDFTLPSVEELQSVNQRIERTQRVLNYLTLRLV